MAVYADTKVMNALFARLNALTWSPTMPVSWPNANFTPPADHRWIRVNEFTAGTQPFGIKGSTTDRTGLMQVDVFRPLGEGHATAKETAAKIAAHFPPGLRLASEGVSVKITKTEPGSVMRDPDAARIMLPVSIFWRAFL